MREDKGWSQTDLADKAGISKSHISRLESGVRWPRYSVVLLLAAALEIAPERIERLASESRR